MISVLALLVAHLPQQKRTPMIYDIEVAPNDQWIAISTSSENIWIYSLAGKLLRTVRHKKGSHLVDIEISPDGSLMVCTNQNFVGDYAPVWSTSTWTEIAKIGVKVNKSFYNPPSGIEFAGNGRFVVGPTLYNHELTCWNAKTGAVEYVARRSRLAFSSFAIYNKSTHAVLGELGGVRMRFWDFENSPRAKEWGSSITGLEPRSVRNMKFSHDGKKLFAITQSQKAFCLFNILKPTGEKTSIAVQARMEGLQPRDSAWSGDDEVVYVCGLAGHIFAFDVAAGTLRKRWIAHDGNPVRAIATTTNGRTVVTGSGTTVALWNGNEGKLLRSFKLDSVTQSR